MMDRPVIIGTGLSSEVGQALIQILRPDWEIVGLGRQPLTGAGVHWLHADFRQPRETWAGVLQRWLDDRAVRVTGFVHAAGLAFSDRVEATTQNEWDSMLAVNLSAAFHLGQVMSPYFQPSSRVVLVGSVDALNASQAGPAAGYGASKAGLMGLMRHWAAEWASRGIRVNGVAPGALQTGNGPQSSEVEDAVVQRIALGRLGRPEEIAQVIAFLLSPESSYVTGAWIPVDGGLNLTY